MSAISEKLPIRFYSQFFHDWEAFPFSERDALAGFLRKLQANPLDLNLLEHAQQDQKGRFASSFAPGYAIYWRLATEEPGPFISLQSYKPTRLDILAVVKI
jgi:hypothetical protein